MMALDILEKGEINTYRINEHDFLMDIRFGKYQKEDGTFNDSFYDMLADFEIESGSRAWGFHRQIVTMM